MTGLSDYFDAESIWRLQQAFSAIMQCPVVIRAAADEKNGQDLYEVPIRMGREIVGAVGIARSHLPDGPQGRTREGDPQAQWRLRFMDLTASLLGRLCADRRELRRRAEQLATLHQVTAEFAARQDLQVVLDQVAKTVVEALGAKACSIRLLDEEAKELVVKAVANLSDEYMNKGPILLSASQIDQEVVRSGKCVYIADERTDPRVLYPAEAAREGIVSALCAAMTYKGRVEGVIRVYTSNPHEFDWFEVSLLEAIAAQAAAAVVNARLYAEAVLAATMKRQLALAGEVQRRMIPSGPPDIPSFDIAAAYVPTYELSGDFYDYISLPRGDWGLAVCDVVGKGVRASLLMAAVRASLRAHVTSCRDIPRVLARVNRDLVAQTQTGDFATLLYGVLNASDRKLTFVNAGHMPPVLVRAASATHLDLGGWPLGINENASWTPQELDLRDGDTILMYTDGLSDAMNFKDEPFGRQRIVDAAVEAVAEGQSAEAIARHVVWRMRCFAGLQTRFDDLTLMVISGPSDRLSAHE